ncbi:MAG: tryptophan 2,3-dioxygenase [Chitinophagaceae bacterium]|nr:tryptophan 2,3-dioxygenase [Chitinophagaceae bacterium]MBK8788032.1 tryptophan 2,3-dioxygenase [Chitinophagaceae bacterium]MBK9483768.1 tryptophan 2,3-dioxygenase [Chitinophagaceae bacterium]
MEKAVYYADYLQLEKITEAQDPESFKAGREPAHDEMLFIIIHQAYELWFKQILFEVNSVIEIMNKPVVNDNSPEMQTVVHRLKRVVTILKVLVQQIDIMETMTPMDFLDFRDMLRPASGFQSYQFKVLEAKLGLKFEQRHGQNYYTSQLKEKDIAIIKDAESGKSVLQLINAWLERMPFITEDFWKNYQEVYVNSLAEAEKNNAAAFETVFNNADENVERNLSPKACRSALFIMMYHGYPMLELPFQLLDTLLEIDNQLSNWRSRHINMVQRMIGTRIGTGGSSGAGYLKAAMDKHYIFKELAQLNSFLVDRKKLPVLGKEVGEKLGYNF